MKLCKIRAVCVCGIGLVAALLLACAIPVTQDYDPSFDFAKLSTYAWLDGPVSATATGALDNQLVDERIRRAVDQALVSKGYSKTAPADASFFVARHASVDKKLELDTTTFGYGWGYRGYGIGGVSNTQVRQYDVGTLLIDVVAPGEEKRLVWRGTGSTRVQDRGTPEQREARIATVVDAILAQFPPPSK